ncbi:MAG: hypothetical protein ACLGJC_16440 [Alphaproteobacteria bacterium]
MGIDGEALSRSHGGFSTKIHIRAEGLGKPVTFTLTGGEVHDSKVFATLMGNGWIRRLGRGRPRLKPDWLAADKANSSGVIRSAPRWRSIAPLIPTKSNARPQPGFRPRCLSETQSRRAPDQPVETVPTDRHPV